jgi:hypothetical protein
VLFQERNEGVNRPRRMTNRPDSHGLETRCCITPQALLRP